jgi:hypothetical protein
VLLTYHLPELGTDLVAALSSLDVKNLTHVGDHERRSSSSWNKTEKNTSTMMERSAQERNAEQRRREMSKSKAERCFGVQRNSRKMKSTPGTRGGKNGSSHSLRTSLSWAFIHSFTRHMDESFHLDQYLSIHQCTITSMKNIVWTIFL